MGPDSTEYTTVDDEDTIPADPDEEEVPLTEADLDDSDGDDVGENTDE